MQSLLGVFTKVSLWACDSCEVWRILASKHGEHQKDEQQRIPEEFL
jgi:hypothetical protein